MCEAHAFVLKNGEEKKLMENVDTVEMDGDVIKIINIFGEQRILKGKMRSYNNTDRKILLESIE
jgi:predicted RNA-binding protein